jgi:hypothetical protein
MHAPGRIKIAINDFTAFNLAWWSISQSKIPRFAAVFNIPIPGQTSRFHGPLNFLIIFQPA